MRVDWYGQAAFHLSGRDGSVFTDPIGDTSGLAGRGITLDYPKPAGVDVDLVLITHEHVDHNGVETIGGNPAVLRSTAGRLESPLGEVVAILPVGAGPTIGPEQAAAIVERLAPRWVVPMHYRTHRTSVLDPPDAFFERMPHVHRLDDTGFDTESLSGDERPLVVVPAVP